MSTSLQFLLFLVVVILCAKVCGAMVARLGLPLVLGELLAGLFLGPTFLNLAALPCFTAVGDSNAVPVFGVFRVMATIGVVVLMFVAGLETDIPMLRRAFGPAFWAAFGGVMVPMAGGCLLTHFAGFSWPEAVFTGTILTATSVTISAQTLINLGQLRSRAGSTILGAAVIDDVLGLIILSLVIALGAHMSHWGGSAWGGLAITLTRMALSLLLLFWAGPPVTRWLLQHAGRLHGSHTELAAALTLGLLLGFVAEALGGITAITGAYLAGLFVAATSARGKVIDDMRAMTNSFFGPLFFVSIGLGVNARQLADHPGLFVLLLAVAVFGKMLGSGIGARLKGFSNRDSMIVGVGMIPRGEVGLITASLGFAAGLVSQSIYAQVVILVLATTLITPPLLRFAFERGKLLESLRSTELVEIHTSDELNDAVVDIADA